MEGDDTGAWGAPLTVRWSHPGRARFEVVGLRGRPRLAAAIESALSGTPEVTSATANAKSGSLLVTYGPEYDLEDIQRVIRSELNLIGDPLGWPAGLPESSLTRILSETLPGWKDRTGAVLLTAVAHSLDILEGMLAISTVNVASGVVPPTLLRIGITNARTQLTVVGLATVAVAGAEFLAQHYRKRSWRALSGAAEHRLRMDVFERLEVQDLAFFDEQGTGPLLNLLTDQVSTIGGFVRGLDELIELLVTVIVSGSALVRASPGLGLISGLAFPAAFVPAQRLGRTAGRDFARRAGADVRLTQVLENILTGIVEVKSFTAEDREAVRVAGLSEALAQASDAADTTAFKQASVIRDIFFATASAAMWYGARLVIAERMPRHQLTRVAYWLPRLMGAFGSMGQLSGTYYAARAGADRLNQVLESRPRIEDGVTRLRPGAVRGEISVENVSFGYDPATPVLHGVSLRAPAARTLGIVGPTGSGKSTLLWLLLRFYEPQSGQIHLDGHDIRDLDLTDLHASISLVSQDVYLFDDTVENNVRYGRPGASDVEVAAALTAAGADDLPLRARTSLGERGHRLSGGQRQRVALARALLKNAPILALDEATSHLDYETEAIIKSSLKSEASDKTIILIAHRLASVREADNIVVLDRGRVLEQGAHQELLDQQGLYYRLWRLEVG